jgi:beta-lactam-binding protein with PASTA domain
VPENDMKSRLDRLEKDLESLRRELDQGGSRETQETLKRLREQVSTLTTEKQQLLNTLRSLQAERLRPTPTQLIDSFREAMDAMQSSLEAKARERIAYNVSHFDVDLKSFVTVDAADKSIRFILPDAVEQFPAEALSTLRFSFHAVPRPEAPEEGMTEIPILLGLSKDAAMIALEQAGLKAGSLTTDESPSRPGSVIRQFPDAGDWLPQGAAVDITLAIARRIQVPSLLGMTIAEADLELQAHGLSSGSMSEEVSTERVGAIIAQSPEAGAIVDPGSAVDIVIAREKTVSVPELRGHQEADALTLLKRAGLAAGQRSTKPSTEQSGLILDQHPEAGAEVAVASPVNYVVGVKELLRIPDVVNLPLEKAVTVLESGGFRRGLVTAKRHASLDGIVLDQSPEAGAEAEAQSAVNLIIAKLFSVNTIVSAISKEAEFRSIGLSQDILLERIKASGRTTPEAMQALLAIPDVQLVSELGLKNVRSARAFKQALTRTLKQGGDADS